MKKLRIRYVIIPMLILCMMTVWMNDLGAAAGSAALVSASETEDYPGEDAQNTKDIDNAASRAMKYSVRELQNYYAHSQVLSVATPGAKVLSGASLIRRGVWQQSTPFQNSCMVMENVTAAARQIIYNHQMSYREYETLLKIVEAEATGGDEYSKMLIAGVVLNRVNDTHFPNTIKEVVWEISDDGSAQFSPTADGRIYSVEVTESTINAVKKVLRGENPAQNALFFVARQSADPEKVKWFDTKLIYLLSYGGHDFFTYKEYGNSYAESNYEAVTK